MKWKLKDILMIGVVGVLFALVYQAANYLGALTVAALTPFGLGALGYEPIYGIWYMAGTFAIYVIQKKGTCIVAEMLAALIEMLLGSMFGPMVFVTGFVQGFGCELGFTVSGYKKFGMRQMLLGSALGAVISFIYNAFIYHYFSYGIGMMLAMVCIRVVSALIFSGILCKLLADGLAKAGVLRGYALGMKQDQPEEIR